MAPVALPRLVAVTDLTQLSAVELLQRSRSLVSSAASGNVAVLLRDHQASAKVRLELGRELRQLTRAAGQKLWVADRIDLALALRADGLHLGEGSVSARDARALMPAGMALSRAWHAPVVASGSELEGVDALLLSPVLEPRKGRPALGLTALGQLAASTSSRVFALGGVTATTAADCLAAGAAGIAAIGAAWSDEAPALLRALGSAR